MNNYLKTALITTLAALALVSLAVAGSRSTAWLGVVTQEVDRHIAKELSLKDDYGAIIDDVVADSPADKIGLKEDDVIIGFNSDKVRDSEDLSDLIHDSKPGDTVSLTIIREGAEQKIAVELGRQPRSRSWFGNSDWYSVPNIPSVPPIPAIPEAPGVYSFYSGDRPYIGVTLVSLSESAAKALGATKGGVLVDDVERDSPAETAGLKPGDLIVQIDKDEIFETEDVQAIIHDMDDGDTVHVSLIRDRKPLTVNVKVELDEGGGYSIGDNIIRVEGLGSSWHGVNRHGRHAYSPDWQEYSNDSKEYQSDMRELQKDLEKMRKELGEMKKSLH